MCMFLNPDLVPEFFIVISTREKQLFSLILNEKSNSVTHKVMNRTAHCMAGATFVNNAGNL